MILQKIFRAVPKPTLFVVVLIMLGFGGSQLIAQDVYGTKQGMLTVVGFMQQTEVTAHSKKLEVLLDYERASFEIILPIRFLHTGIDSLDQIFRANERGLLNLQGEMGIAYINTKDHPPQVFAFHGRLDYLEFDFKIEGEGVLQHIYGGGKFACVLELSFELDPLLLGLDYFDKGLLTVQIKETVLDQLSDGYR